MVVCVSCTRDVLLGSKSLLTHRRRFDCDEALLYMRRCVSVRQLKQIHSRMVRSGLDNDQLLVRKMIELCSSFGELDYAAMVFKQVLEPVTFTWNMMIRVYDNGGRSRSASLLYNYMICQGVRPDKFTFPFVVKACTECLLLDKGKEVHGMAIKSGLYKDMYLRNTLSDFYLKCGDLISGRKLFEKMRVKNVVSWTIMVAGLVDCGELDNARKVFEQMPVRNVVTWSVMIDAYARSGLPQDAFELFRRMQLENVRPNDFTLVSLLRSATGLESLKLGSWVHDFALKNGFEIGVFLGTALIDMYSKCGSVEQAKRVFEKMQSKSIATWNTMITSLGVHGMGEQAIDLFRQLEKTGLCPDAITFVAVLSACVTIHNFTEGYRVFKQMIELYGIPPIQEHYECMIDLRRWAKVLHESFKVEEHDPMEENGADSSSFCHPNSVSIEGEPGIESLDEALCPSTHLIRSFMWDSG
ncbi:hypothetical protein QQ045_022057 [Rhodiola kirilowii]